jgi:hypothetical protein
MTDDLHASTVFIFKTWSSYSKKVVLYLWKETLKLRSWKQEFIFLLRETCMLMFDAVSRLQFYRFLGRSNTDTWLQIALSFHCGSKWLLLPKRSSTFSHASSRSYHGEYRDQSQLQEGCRSADFKN